MTMPNWDLELVRTTGDGRPIAVAAEVGVTRLIRRRMQETNAQLRRISGAWETVHALAAEGRQPGDFEQIEGAQQVDERVWELALDAGEVSRSYRSCRTPTGPVRW
jgi:hypothetical protein